MRLLALEFQALGPFAGHHRIDFTKFEPSGLYLLKGHTGSGKSTIIDAITFALYGRVAGGSTSTTQRLRSNHASRDKDTYVRLRFETSHGTYQVTRRPSYLKEGNKNETPGTATLVKLISSSSDAGDPGDETYEEIASGIKPVGDAIPEIVGLGLNQFLQTVVLPQGKFADFIHSSPSERKDLLEEIFGTEHFRLFAESLRQQSREARETYETTRNRVIIQADEMAPEISEGVAGELYEKAIGFALNQLDARRQERDQQQDLVTAYQETLQELKATDDERARATDASNRWTKATETLAQLEEESEQHEADVKQLEHAREAQKVASDVAADKRAKQALNDAAGEVAEAQGALRLGPELADTAKASDFPDADLVSVVDAVLLDSHADHSKIDERLDDLTREHTRIEAAEQDVERLETLREKLTSLDQEQSTTKSKIAQDEITLEKFKPAAENIERAITELEKLGDELPALQKTENELNSRHQTAQERDQKILELTKASKEISIRKRELNETKSAATDVIAGWLNDSALVLAEHLVEGDPCPVCGSVEHPDPLTGDRTDITSDALREAQEKVKSAEVSLETALARQADLTKLIEGLNKKAGGDTVSIEIALDEARQESQKALDASKQAREYRVQLDAARKEVEEIKDRIAESKTRLSVIANEQAQARTEIEKLTKTIEQARGDFESVADRREYLTARRTRVQTLAESLQVWLNAYHHSEETSQVLQKALEDSQFESVQAVEEATLDRDAIKNLEEQVRSHVLKRKMAERERDEAEATGLIRDTIPAPLTSAISRTQTRLDQVRQDYAVVNNEFSSYERKVERLRSGIEQLQTLRAESGPLRVLSDLAQGAELEDGRRISFDTWVIMRQFERVLEAANPFLEKFSSSRYELRRVALDPSLRNQAAGLGLAIYDSETDDYRAPASLSGGETFYCSLALALGLVEVVSSEAGGINLQSMLIDEGFGSLDAETLDQVMIGLERLRDSGRTVGVVSHVAEMQRRISDGITVKANPEGGSTLEANPS